MSPQSLLIKNIHPPHPISLLYFITLTPEKSQSSCIRPHRIKLSLCDYWWLFLQKQCKGRTLQSNFRFLDSIHYFRFNHTLIHQNQINQHLLNIYSAHLLSTYIEETYPPAPVISNLGLLNLHLKYQENIWEWENVLDSRIWVDMILFLLPLVRLLAESL